MLINIPQILKTQRKKPTIRKFKPFKTSIRTERWYKGELLNFVKQLQAEVQSAVENGNVFSLQDADDKPIRHDLSQIIRRLIERKIDATAQRISQGFVSRGDVQNQQEQATLIRQSTGIDLADMLKSSPRVAEKLQTATQANVELIKSIRSQYLDKVQTAVTQAVMRGALNKDLAVELKRIGGITENRAKLIARDQTAKLNAALTRARHEDTGATKYRWCTCGDERVRESHMANNGKVFAYDDPPETGNPGDEINCFPGDLKVYGFPRLEKLYRRWYSGEFTELILDNGVVLTATPHHPVLTDKGIKPIQSINVGDYVACEVQQGFHAIKLNGENLIPTFEKIFSTLLLCGVDLGVSPPNSGKFHGDTANSEIDIIAIDSFLIDIWDRLRFEKLPKLGFTDSDMVFCKMIFSCNSSSIFFNKTFGSSTSSVMSRFDLICSLLARHLTPLELFCLGLVANSYVIGQKMSSYNISCNTEMFGNHIFAAAALVHSADFIYWQRDRIRSSISSSSGHIYAESFQLLADRLFVATNLNSDFSHTQSLFGIEFCRVVDKVVRQSSCHIYNLQTISGYYNTNLVMVSNCRCIAIPIYDDNIKTEKEETTESLTIVQTTGQSQTKNERTYMRSTWDSNFPDTVIDRKLGDATSHPFYEQAKKGDVTAAYQLAKDLVTDDAVEKLREIIAGRDAILVPVHAEEAIGRNMIPVATATVLAKKLNIPVDLSIVQATKVSRTGADGWHRIIYSPEFDGIYPKNKLAIILDDTQTQGGTLASLKGYIENQQGKVIGAYALTGKQYSVQLRLSTETLSTLREKYGTIESWWKNEFGYDFSKLTEWEARFIINSRKTPDEVRNTILARK